MIQPVLFSLSALGLLVAQLVSSKLHWAEPFFIPQAKVSSQAMIFKGNDRTHCQNVSPLNFLVFAGGPNPSGNEIALEKNVLYFQRTLKHLGYPANRASVFFANGNNGQASIRYLDGRGRQRFKVPQIPGVKGPATYLNLQRSLQQSAPLPGKASNLFFYFTGHGGLDERNPDNNYMYLWNNQSMSVQQFAGVLDRMPKETSIVTMMAQCYSGSFTNFVHEGGNPRRPLAAQNRCGFFATIKTLPSVGCTPAVNEADYKDYSSSFFAGLSGRSRVGKTVTSADYNQDGRVSYTEAHAFAKVDEYTTDLPISTSEAWLQDRLTNPEIEEIFRQPMQKVLQTARPEQLYVVTSLVKITGFSLDQSFAQVRERAKSQPFPTEEQEAYAVRVGMELLNIGAEQKIRSRSNPQDIASLNKLLRCENGSWE